MAKALKQGLTCSANDIVVHRTDGRRVALVTWAAPVQLSGPGRADAAVWVLEDMAAFQPSESSGRDSETLLRTVIETLADGVLVQDATGQVLEGNAAAGRILGVSRDRLIGRVGLAAEAGCLSADGRELPREQYPDLQAARTGVPVRDVVIGIVQGDRLGPRWLRVNILPLPNGAVVGAGPRRPRVVTSFADITEHVTVGQNGHSLPPAHDLPKLLRLIRELAEAGQGDLPADHPALQALRHVLELSSRAAHLATQVLASQPSESDAAQ